MVDEAADSQATAPSREFSGSTIHVLPAFLSSISRHIADNESRRCHAMNWDLRSRGVPFRSRLPLFAPTAVSTFS